MRNESGVGSLESGVWKNSKPLVMLAGLLWRGKQQQTTNNKL